MALHWVPFSPRTVIEEQCLKTPHGLPLGEAQLLAGWGLVSFEHLGWLGVGMAEEGPGLRVWAKLLHGLQTSLCFGRRSSFTQAANEVLRMRRTPW